MQPTTLPRSDPRFGHRNLDPVCSKRHGIRRMNTIDTKHNAVPFSIPRSAYIVSPAYDWSLFLLPPLLALFLGFVIKDSWVSNDIIEFAGYEQTLAGLLIGIFIHAHLFAVFFRSHGNPEIFRQFRSRFLIVPAVLFLGIVSSNWILISVSVVATFWDVYHSALQTFGFARIYDSKYANDPTLSRRLDWWLNQLLYAGPILAGATMMDHFEEFESFEEVGAAFFTSIPIYMDGYQQYYAWVVIFLGCAFLFFYLFTQLKLVSQGYRISPLKVYLLVTTGFVSIFSWGFDSWGEAFLIMNFFHALQYFGIVWAREKSNIVRIFNVDNVVFGKYLAFGLFLAVTFGYGLWTEVIDTDVTTLWAVTLTVSIMHFWYDGFIWSIQKKQI